MSNDQARRFIQKIADDAALRDTVQGKTVEEIARIAQAQGYAFTAVELEQAQQESQGEIADADLDAVSGGLWPPAHRDGCSHYKGKVGGGCD